MGYVAPVVNVIDVRTREIVMKLPLRMERVGGGSQGFAGRQVCGVPLIVGQFKPPTEHLKKQWMNGNALTLIDLEAMEVLGTVLLDDRNRGAANPSACAWTRDGKRLLVTHAGTHEVSIIDFPDLVEKVLALPAPMHPANMDRLVSASPEEIAWRRICVISRPASAAAAAEGGLGTSAVVVVENTAYVANYFSDTLSMIDLSKEPRRLSRFGWDQRCP